jgi:hypothetical protein
LDQGIHELVEPGASTHQKPKRQGQTRADAKASHHPDDTGQCIMGKFTGEKPGKVTRTGRIILLKRFQIGYPLQQNLRRSRQYLGIDEPAPRKRFPDNEQHDRHNGSVQGPFKNCHAFVQTAVFVRHFIFNDFLAFSSSSSFT